VEAVNALGPDYGDGFRMGRESRDKEIEALQAELASERRAHAETKREQQALKTLRRCEHRNTVPSSAGTFCADCGAEL
jgi:hypothetical protein